MNRRLILNRWLFLFSVPFTLYLLAIAYHLNLSADILSPVNALMAATVLFLAYGKGNVNQIARRVYLFEAIACLSWGIADVCWAVLNVFGKDPSENMVLWVLYAISNLFLCLGMFSMVMFKPKQWSIAQFVVDFASIVIVCGISIWIVFFKDDTAALVAFFELDFTSLVSVLLDICIGIGILNLIVSMRKISIPAHLMFVVAGMGLYILVDLVYYYVSLHDRYLPNGLIDGLYAASFFTLAMGGMVVSLDPDIHEDAKQEEVRLSNIGFMQRWTFVSICPVAVILLQATGVIDVKISLAEVMAYSFIILENWSMSKYIQLSIENARLYQISLSQNIALQDRVIEQKRMLSTMSDKDILTGLFNRKYFLNALLNGETLTDPPRKADCLVIVDIDRLKVINDSFGTDAGDHVISEFAQRLVCWNTFSATLARVSGDEFGILLSGGFNSEQLSELCQDILRRMRSPIQLSESQVEVTASVGAVLPNRSLPGKHELWHNANLALYHAKSRGYDQYQIFDPTVFANVLSKNRIEVLLKQSNYEKDFELYYQPQFSLPNKTLVGAEALIRWKTQEFDYISPNVFIPIAEEIGYIHRLGKWVIHEAVCQTKKWNRNRQAILVVSINISPVQLKDEGLVEYIHQQLTAYEVEASWLEVEITESVLLQLDEQTRKVLEQLRGLGLKIAIDDFGSGHASFGYLSEFSFQKVKLDKILINKTNKMDVTEVNVLRAIIDMSKQMGIQTIAEGVETKEQLMVLEYLGCDQVQGFLLGRPVQSNEFKRLFLDPSDRP